MTPDVHQLDSRLATILARWNAIGAEMGGDVLREAETMFTAEVCPWACDVVTALGLANVGEADNPPALARGDEAWEPAKLLTGTPNVVEAGRRIIFWSAACHQPELCRRTHPSFRFTVLAWAAQWIVIPSDEAGWRTFRQPLDWVRIAWDELRAKVPAAPSGRLQSRRDRSLRETLALAALLRLGPNVTRIAESIGVKRTTLLGWPAFRERLEQVKADAAIRRRRLPGGESWAKGHRRGVRARWTPNAAPAEAADEDQADEE